MFDSQHGLQGSLLEDVDADGLSSLAPHRHYLADGAWVDIQPGWVGGADELFFHLRDHVDWQAERRWMYDREVATPRLLRFYESYEPLPHPLLSTCKAELSQWYHPELGEPFTTAGMCLYRDGRDSVAWHGDRIGRSREHDTMVAILSLGAPRPLLLRPASQAARAAGTGTLTFALGHGDLLVMGGSAQRTWEHAVPKVAGATGPRISVQFRPHDVR
ncbi:alpha-ketoglutarate-dependent dioxygenase AlkB [Gephyromycinifex aptenodytis]|uniref:alpha-ketoglutarate-dependent dioxygenase AlkB n=1 Tax=Gephyromycinifex aptenodytis TaxID=2716227 RepID=UPI0014467D7B|nr:alpha-ketoglutarate-dependent dioxygenase AlkB [Gephyromycinifex aptenodytis]